MHLPSAILPKFENSFCKVASPAEYGKSVSKYGRK